MDLKTFKTILGNNSISDDEATVLLNRATKKAVNHYFWQEDDNPTEDEVEKFTNRYEYEIYDVAKAMYDSDSRDGLKQFVELGVSRTWQDSGDKVIEKALSAIIPKTYVS